MLNICAIVVFVALSISLIQASHVPATTASSTSGNVNGIGVCPDVTGMTQVNPIKVMGTWYELAVAPNPGNMTVDCPKITLTQTSPSEFDYDLTASIDQEPYSVNMANLQISNSPIQLNSTYSFPNLFLEIQQMLLDTDYTSYYLSYQCQVVNLTVTETYYLFGRKPTMNSISSNTLAQIQQLMSSTSGLTQPEYYYFNQTNC